MRRLAVAAVLVVLAGCGSRQPGIGATASEVLGPQVAAIREAVEAGSAETATERLELLKITALRLRQEGTLDEEAWTRVLQAAQDVEAFLAVESQPQTSEDSPPLEVPLEDIGTVQQAPAVDGDDGEGGDDGEDGERGEKGAKGRPGEKGGKGKKDD